MMDMSKRKRICVKKEVDDLKLEIMVNDFKYMKLLFVEKLFNFKVKRIIFLMNSFLQAFKVVMSLHKCP